MEKPEKDSNKKMGWEDSAKSDWMALKEQEGRRNWKERWGPGNPWMARYEKWIDSGISRIMRKPSRRSLEWLAWKNGMVNETPSQGENRTRIREKSQMEFIMQPSENYHCKPCPYPLTTSGEVGWLAQQGSCQLEIYGNDYMKKPPLPWYMPKIATYLSNSQ